MKTIFTAVALLASGALASLTVNTPSNVVECQPTLLSWSGGTGLPTTCILPGASPTGTAIESFPATNSTSYTWTVNIAQGTYIGFTLRDSTGTVAQSAAVSVQPGTSDCLTSSSSAITGASAPASTSGASATSAGASAATTSSGASVSSSNAATTPASSASTSSSSSSSTGGSPANVAQFGAAGLAGAVVAAILL